MKKQLSIGMIAATMMLSAGFAATSYAASPDTPQRGMMDGSRGPGSGYHMMQGGSGHHMYGQGMRRLHDELKLDDRQETLWRAAEQGSRDQRQGMFDRMRKNHDEIKSMMDKPGADLRAIAKRMDEFRDESFKERNAMRDRWLTVYDSLNPDQKEKTRVFFKDRMDRMGQGMDRSGQERRGQGRHHGRQGQPAPAPTN